MLYLNSQDCWARSCTGAMQVILILTRAPSAERRRLTLGLLSLLPPSLCTPRIINCALTTRFSSHFSTVLGACSSLALRRRGSLGADSTLQPSYIKSFEASTALIIASGISISIVWWLMHGDLKNYPRIRARVMAQTQIRPEDESESSVGRELNEKAVV